MRHCAELPIVVAITTLAIDVEISSDFKRGDPKTAPLWRTSGMLPVALPDESVTVLTAGLDEAAEQWAPRPGKGRTTAGAEDRQAREAGRMG